MTGTPHALCPRVGCRRGEADRFRLQRAEGISLPAGEVSCFRVSAKTAMIGAPMNGF